MKQLWLETPASEWEEGFPIGNGSLGAMVLGGVKEDSLYLNEDSLWYGRKRDRHNPVSKCRIGLIRKLLYAGEVEKAQYLAKAAYGSTPKYINP